jgi:transcriptional regulator with XRE-family HTH domain
MSAPVPHLNNEELGALIGLSESGASLLRNGYRGPSATVQRAIVEHLGVDFDTLNAAIVAREAGDAQPLVRLLDMLSETDRVGAWQRREIPRHTHVNA